jgi:hypothetical protein
MLTGVKSGKMVCLTRARKHEGREAGMHESEETWLLPDNLIA